MATPSDTTPLPDAGDRTAPQALRAVAGFVRRLWAGAEAAVACLLFWQDVSRTIARLSAFGDAALARRGLARSEIVSAVYRAAQAERADAKTRR
jgi:hypothetical protein